MSTDESVWTDEDARRFTAPCVDRWQWDAWLAAHDARVRRDAAQAALLGAEHHIRANMDEPYGDRAANRVADYARTYHPEETP